MNQTKIKMVDIGNMDCERELPFYFQPSKSIRDVASLKKTPLAPPFLSICMHGNAMISREIRKLTYFRLVFDNTPVPLCRVTTYQYNNHFILPIIYTHTHTLNVFPQCLLSK